MTQLLNTSITTRLSIVKNIIALALLTTLASTWPLWSSDRYFPVFPGSELFTSVNLIFAYAIPLLLVVSLAMIFLFRKPRFFISFAALLCVTLLVLDAGRSHYWFYFYLMILLLLAGYNWRVDNANHYTTFFLILKIMLAGVYMLTALQHFQYEFVHTMWPQFIKPFERFWTPEQCAYLQKVAYVIPFLEIFVAFGLFFNGTRVAAICFALLFHLFSFSVLLMQDPQTEIAVLLWHLSMTLLVCVIFAGTPAGQKNQNLSLNFYPVFVMVVFGIIVPAYFVMTDEPLKNKIDLMESNAIEQYVYIARENKSKLPFYVQSFVKEDQSEFSKLSVTSWVLHETNTKQILGGKHLTQLSNSLNRVYGTESVVSLPVNDKLKDLALK